MSNAIDISDDNFDSEVLESDKPVLIDATHAMRPWRLALTQGIKFNKPIEWVGWWIRTPKEVCLKWNQKRG